MNQAAKDVLNLLVLKEASDHQFVCEQEHDGTSQIFGGQLIAQAICAAAKTVEQSKQLVSVQSSFIAPGKLSQEVNFAVSTLRDGRAFSSRRVEAKQADTPFFSATALFHAQEQSVEFQQPMPKVALPADCPGLSEMIRQYQFRFPEHLPGFDPDTAIQPQAIESRFPDITGYFSPADSEMDSIAANLTGVTEQPMWMRFNSAPGELAAQAEDPIVHRAILASVGDQGISHVIAQVLGVGGLNPNVRLLSLDHSLWFHRQFQVDEWFLMVRRCVSFTSNIAFITGEFYDLEGNIIANMSQQTLYRLS